MNLQAEDKRTGPIDGTPLRDIFDSLGEAIFIHDVESGHIVDVNRRMCEMFGYAYEEALRLTIGELSSNAPGFTQQEAENWLRKALDGELQVFEWQSRHKNGLFFWTEVSMRLATVGEHPRILVTARHISRRKELETALAKRTAMYRLLSVVYDEIVHNNDLDRLIYRVCEVLSELGAFKLAWIGRENPQTHRVDILCASGEAKAYADDLQISTLADDPQGQGPTGTAIREGHPVVASSAVSDAHLGPWLDRMRAFGIESSISLPIRNANFSGALNVYAGDQHFFDHDTLVFLAEMADGLQFSIRRIEEMREREESLRQVRLIASVFDESAEGMLICDAENRILTCNRAFCTLTGFRREEVVGQAPSLLRAGHHEEAFYQQLWDCVHEVGHWRGELWSRRRSGELFQAWTVISLARDAQGAPQNYFCVFSDLTEAKAQAALIERMRSHDALTGLPNRLLLQDRVSEALTHAHRHDQHVALLAINIDRFHLINETLGHKAGDDGLIRLSQRFTSIIGEGNTLSHLAGDTFVVAMPDLANEQEAVRVAAEIVRVAHEPIGFSGAEITLSASVGIALSPENGLDFGTLLRNAEAALDKARSSGGNQSCFFTRGLNEAAMRTLALSADLRRAVTQNWLELYYQPQIDAFNGQIVAIESLLRLRHPEHGLMVADDFIAIAEQSGAILPMGRWAIQAACHQIKRWHDEGFEKPVVTVNLSPSQFRDPGLVAFLGQTIAESGINARFLELEFNENVVINDFSSALNTLNALRQLGVRLTIDGFGTGHTNLQYLKRLPVSRLKINPSFIHNIAQEANDSAIVRAILSMAQAFGISVVAKGVETEAQAGHLRSLHCPVLQGHLFAEPAPAHAITRLLGAPKRAQGSTAAARCLLLVDDEAHVLTALQRVLRREGYTVLTAGSGSEALEVMAKNTVCVVLSDQRMPNMTGTELMSRVRQMYPKTIRMILSGYSEATSIAEAINKGEVYRYISKPWDNDELLSILREAFTRYEDQLSACGPEGA